MVLLAGALSSLTGCSAHLYSQPGRVAPLEAAKTVDDGKHSVGAFAGPTEVHGLEMTQASVRYRQGVGEHVEVGADANLRVVTNMDDGATAVNPTIWSGRLATKWAPEMFGDYFAVIGGIAGGTSEAGQFVSPDLGVVFSYENKYVVPFLSADGYVSVPINAKQVDLSKKSQEPGTRVGTPQVTLGLTNTLGVRVPIVLETVTVAPMMGVSLSLIRDHDEHVGAAAANAGLDVLF